MKRDETDRGRAEPLTATQSPHVRLAAVVGSVFEGETALIGLTFTIEPEWHIYWDGLNDSGTAPRFAFEWPDGWVQGKTMWPVPKRQVLPGDIVDYVYEKEVTLLVPVFVPAGQPEREIEIPIRAKWLVCSNVCVPEKGQTTLRVGVLKPTTPSAERVSQPPRIADVLSRLLPKPLTAASGVNVETEASRLRIEAKGATVIRFMPASWSVGLLNAAADGESKRDVLDAELESAETEHSVIAGVIEIVRTGETEAYWFERPLVNEPIRSDGAGEGVVRETEK